MKYDVSALYAKMWIAWMTVYAAQRDGIEIQFNPGQQFTYHNIAPETPTQLGLSSTLSSALTPIFSSYRPTHRPTWGGASTFPAVTGHPPALNQPGVTASNLRAVIKCMALSRREMGDCVAGWYKAVELCLAMPYQGGCLISGFPPQPSAMKPALCAVSGSKTMRWPAGPHRSPETMSSATYSMKDHRSGKSGYRRGSWSKRVRGGGGPPPQEEEEEVIPQGEDDIADWPADYMTSKFQFGGTVWPRPSYVNPVFVRDGIIGATDGYEELTEEYSLLMDSGDQGLFLSALQTSRLMQAGVSMILNLLISLARSQPGARRKGPSNYALFKNVSALRYTSRTGLSSVPYIYGAISRAVTEVSEFVLHISPFNYTEWNVSSPIAQHELRAIARGHLGSFYLLDRWPAVTMVWPPNTKVQDVKDALAYNLQHVVYLDALTAKLNIVILH
ncbi:Hypothetical protein FKW44_001775 [Caligus rogercresseyi]|uniref:Uncharacterized protein n=1 Tax=Caligus rogercresseyi TaxID=217165 RepID=A0A7T8KJF3_CALRO|nr:Hypothetical protein FKW44_001775 [Caligus rogercresseyi]